MSRPCTLVRSSSESICTTHARRPVHLLLRAPSASHAAPVHRDQQAAYGSRPATDLSRASTATSRTSFATSVFDEDRAGASPSISELSDDGYFSEAWGVDDEPAALDLSDSGFTSVPVPLFAESDCLLQVSSLDMSQNPLDGSVEDYLCETIHLPNLESLRLQSCGVSSIEPLIRHLRAPNLKELDISNHRLEGSVPHLQRFFPKLQTLIARDGLFEQLDEAAVAGLAVLDLSNNLLRDDSGRLCERCEELGTRLLL